MKKSITQEFEYGCGIACFAFVTDASYQQAAEYLGLNQAQSSRFWCKDLTVALNEKGKPYVHKYVKPAQRNKIYQEGAIVLIARSKRYPSGHYLVRHHSRWMDPWINVCQNHDITMAKSGFRQRLPGRPMYVFYLTTR